MVAGIAAHLLKGVARGRAAAKGRRRVPGLQAAAAPHRAGERRLRASRWPTCASRTRRRATGRSTLSKPSVLGTAAARLPHQLSGGQQQRVAIARAVVAKPPLLIADEPTGNLDQETAWEIMDLFSDIAASGTAVLVATHNVEIVTRLQRRVLTLVEGRLVRDQQAGHIGEDGVAGIVLKGRFPRRRLIQIVATNLARHVFGSAARNWARNLARHDAGPRLDDVAPPHDGAGRLERVRPVQPRAVRSRATRPCFTSICETTQPTRMLTHCGIACPSDPRVASVTYTSKAHALAHAQSDPRPAGAGGRKRAAIPFRRA